MSISHSFSSSLRTLWWRLVRFGFRLLYNELAWTYDAVSWVVSLGLWRAWQRAALPYVEGRDVLELAHGPGHMQRDLLRLGFTAVGLDLSPAMGRLARRRLARAGLITRLVRGRGETLPFPENSFDTILSTFPTEFIFAPETLAEVRRILRPGGRFLIVPNGRLPDGGPSARFIAWLYLITGQRAAPFEEDAAGHWRPPPALVVRFAAAGWVLDVVDVPLARGGGATLLLARPRQARANSQPGGIGL